ncbi:MAG: peptidylprolyl isomerase [Motiliproteus sp.]|nr:peptidylprolyl isomerase [Motiliproteus sp.]MCW9053271.1 peptidylprolyl isomerase [Motiliproteus sp.]
MIVEKNKVVSFNYRLKDEQGEELERSDENQPALYMHGHGGMLPGLEKAMAGKTAGESYEVTLSPEEAYGPIKSDATGRVPLKHVKLPGQKPVKGRLKPGAMVEINTKDGLRQARVIKMGLKSVDIDTNHPLAGKTISFEIEIVEVRDASEEELAHGHAHGPGGHQH